MRDDVDGAPRLRSVTDERKQLADAARVWTDAVGEGPFLAGQTPGVADVAVYGVFSSIRGLVAHDELMGSSPALAAWVARVRGPSAAPCAARTRWWPGGTAPRRR